MKITSADACSDYERQCSCGTYYTTWSLHGCREETNCPFYEESRKPDRSLQLLTIGSVLVSLIVICGIGYVWSQ